MEQFQSLANQINRAASTASKPLSSWTKYELHKYLQTVLRMTLPHFTTYVGEYDASTVDITGFMISAGDAVRQATILTKEGMVMSKPVEKLIRTSVELVITPFNYVVTNTLGQTSTVEMNRGLPATAGAEFIIAHSNLTYAMATSAPNIPPKTEFKGETRSIVGPTITDVDGKFYPPICAMGLIPALSDPYKGRADIVDVRASILQDGLGKGNIMLTPALALHAMNAQLTIFKDKGTYQNAWKPFDCVRPMEDEKKVALASRYGIPAVELLPSVKVPSYSIQDMQGLYTFIETHRTIRGSNKDKVSLLTHAVYYGETDSKYRSITGAADILYIAGALGATAVHHATHPTFKKAWSILYLNMPVIDSTMNYEEFKSQKHGCYRLRKDDLTTAVLHIDSPHTVQPSRNSKTKRWEFTPSEEDCIETIRSRLADSKFIAIKAYAMTSLWTEFPGQIWPSLHAHAGDVWVTNDKTSPYTLVKHLERTMKANVYKTYYPCMFKRFPKDDFVKWPPVAVVRCSKRKIMPAFDLVLQDEFDGTVTESIDLDNLDTVQQQIFQKLDRAQDRNPAVAEFAAEIANNVAAQQAEEPELSASQEEGFQLDEEENNFSDDDSPPPKSIPTKAPTPVKQISQQKKPVAPTPPKKKGSEKKKKK